MAVATSVLERISNSETEKKEYIQDYRDTLSADERHNSLIRRNYARLINPEATVNDVIIKEPVNQYNYVEKPVVKQEPYLVKDARADSYLFRADSAINSKASKEEVKDIEVAQAQPTEEEENEDLRPTPTTTQYRTEAVAKTAQTAEISKISNKSAWFANLTKRDKVVIAVALTVIVALFVLIIVNSAVLSNLNSELSVLQADLATAQAEYAMSLQAKEAYLNEQNIFNEVSKFATEMGMVLR